MATHTWMRLVLGLMAPLAAQAQASDFSASLGLKVWHVDWSTFGYAIDSGGNTLLVQAPAKSKTLLLPVASVRWGDFTASVSGYRGTEMAFANGERATRQELDANLGYFVLPGVAITAGYKRFELANQANTKSGLQGPVFGLSMTAPVGHGVSVYGTVGRSRLGPTSDSVLRFKADYSLLDLGLAYTVPLSGLAKAVTVTLGYRSQSINAKNALRWQTASDSAEGIALGSFVAF